MCEVLHREAPCRNHQGDCAIPEATRPAPFAPSFGTPCRERQHCPLAEIPAHLSPSAFPVPLCNPVDVWHRYKIAAFEAGLSFRVNLQPGQKARLLVHLGLCTADALLPDLFGSARSYILLEKLEASRPLGFATTDAEFYTSGAQSCVQFDARSSAIAEDISFQEISIAVMLVPKPEKTWPSIVFSAETPSALSMIVRNADFTTPFSSDPGRRVTMIDTVPPVFVGCPSPLSFTDTDGRGLVPATWTEPVATDNIRVSEVQRTIQGSNGAKPMVELWASPPAQADDESSFVLSMAQSPFLVSYTATDEAGLVGRCTFTVQIQ